MWLTFLFSYFFFEWLIGVFPFDSSWDLEVLFSSLWMSYFIQAFNVRPNKLTCFMTGLCYMTNAWNGIELHCIVMCSNCKFWRWILTFAVEVATESRSWGQVGFPWFFCCGQKTGQAELWQRRMRARTTSMVVGKGTRILTTLSVLLKAQLWNGLLEAGTDRSR